MNISESMNLLEKIGVAKWALEDIQMATQIFVEAVAEYHLANTNPLDLRPFIESDYVHGYFIEFGWEIDWYLLVSGEFSKAVEDEIKSIAQSANEVDPLMSVADFEQYILDWVYEWTARAQTTLRNALASHV